MGDHQTANVSVCGAVQRAPRHVGHAAEEAADGTAC
jgi:hypothetical protein